MEVSKKTKISILQSSIKTIMETGMGEGLRLFQFYKVRLKPCTQSRHSSLH